MAHILDASFVNRYFEAIDVENSIVQMTNLRRLDISHNEIERPPRLPSTLMSLNLSHNRSYLNLAGFAVSRLPHLRELVLSHNELISTNGLSYLTSLEILNLSYNKLRSVAGLEMLTSLKVLILNDNCIESLSSLRCLSCNLELEYLDVRNNAVCETKSYANLKNFISNLCVLDGRIIKAKRFQPPIVNINVGLVNNSDNVIDARASPEKATMQVDLKKRRDSTVGRMINESGITRTKNVTRNGKTGMGGNVGEGMYDTPMMTKKVGYSGAYNTLHSHDDEEEDGVEDYSDPEGEIISPTTAALYGNMYTYKQQQARDRGGKSLVPLSTHPDLPELPCTSSTPIVNGSYSAMSNAGYSESYGSHTSMTKKTTNPLMNGYEAQYQESSMQGYVTQHTSKKKTPVGPSSAGSITGAYNKCANDEAAPTPPLPPGMDSFLSLRDLNEALTVTSQHDKSTTYNGSSREDPFSTTAKKKHRVKADPGRYHPRGAYGTPGNHSTFYMDTPHSTGTHQDSHGSIYFDLVSRKKSPLPWRNPPSVKPRPWHGLHYNEEGEDVDKWVPTIKTPDHWHHTMLNETQWIEPSTWIAYNKSKVNVSNANLLKSQDILNHPNEYPLGGQRVIYEVPENHKPHPHSSAQGSPGYALAKEDSFIFSQNGDGYEYSDYIYDAYDHTPYQSDKAERRVYNLNENSDTHGNNGGSMHTPGVTPIVSSNGNMYGDHLWISGYEGPVGSPTRNSSHPSHNDSKSKANTHHHNQHQQQQQWLQEQDLNASYTSTGDKSMGESSLEYSRSTTHDSPPRVPRSKESHPAIPGLEQRTTLPRAPHSPPKVKAHYAQQTFSSRMHDSPVRGNLGVHKNSSPSKVLNKHILHALARARRKRHEQGNYSPGKGKTSPSRDSGVASTDAANMSSRSTVRAVHNGINRSNPMTSVNAGIHEDHYQQHQSHQSDGTETMGPVEALVNSMIPANQGDDHGNVTEFDFTANVNVHNNRDDNLMDNEDVEFSLTTQRFAQLQQERDKALFVVSEKLQSLGVSMSDIDRQEIHDIDTTASSNDKPREISHESHEILDEGVDDVDVADVRSSGKQGDDSQNIHTSMRTGLSSKSTSKTDGRSTKNIPTAIDDDTSSIKSVKTGLSSKVDNEQQSQPSSHSTATSADVNDVRPSTYKNTAMSATNSIREGNDQVNVDDDVSVKGHGMMEQSIRSSRPKDSRKENDNGIKKVLEMDGGRKYDDSSR